MKRGLFTSSIVLLIVVLASFSWPGNVLQDPIKKIIAQLDKQMASRPQEKIYLHLDKPYYAAGDDIWFKAYLLDASTHAPSELSQLVYVELINPADTVLQRLILKKDKGNFNGSFALSDSLPEGNYKIRAYTNWMRNFSPGDSGFFFTRDLPIGNNRLSNVKMNVEYEADYSKSPAELIARFTFSDENGNAIQDKDIEYEHILMGHAGEKKTATTDEQGRINVRIAPASYKLNPNQYLRVTINYDRLPFSRNFYVPDIRQKADIQFFPEGGRLIADVPNIVAFKAINVNGEGIPVKGKVYDQSGREVATLGSRHRGMGKFSLSPAAGDRYTARIRLPHGETVEQPLPEVEREGYLLNVTPRDTSVQVRIAASSARLRSRPVYLVAQTRGQVHYAAQAVLEKELYQADIPKSRFPDGITQLTLFDMNLIPVAERLVFIHNGKQLDISISPDKPDYKAREKVNLKLDVRDTTGNPVRGEFSISVTDDAVVNREGSPDILTNLLLTSDLQGHIEDPAWYFSDNPRVPEALDLLMLTQGWRRFNWKKVMAGELQEVPHPLELGLEIAGQVYDPSSGKPMPGAQVIMLTGRKKEPVLEDTTDRNGMFRFSGYDFPDSTRVVIQARDAKGRRTGAVRILDDYPSLREIPERFPANISQRISDYMEVNKETFEGTILLDPVTVTAEKAPRSTGLHSRADHVLTEEDIQRFGGMWNVYQVIQGRLPGVVVTGNRIRIRGSLGDPLVVVDGVRMLDASILGMINIYDIETIEVLKGPNAAIYGLGSANGVIVINTKRGEPRTVGTYERRGLISYFPKGYHEVREFYMPKYQNPKKLNDKEPDLRTTIYWKGDIKTDAEGSATISFYTADPSTTYTAVVEGVSTGGLIGHAETTLNRQATTVSNSK